MNRGYYYYVLDVDTNPGFLVSSCKRQIIFFMGRGYWYEFRSRSELCAGSFSLASCMSAGKLGKVISAAVGLHLGLLSHSAVVHHDMVRSEPGRERK